MNIVTDSTDLSTNVTNLVTRSTDAMNLADSQVMDIEDAVADFDKQKIVSDYFTITTFDTQTQILPGETLDLQNSCFSIAPEAADPAPGTDGAAFEFFLSGTFDRSLGGGNYITRVALVQDDGTGTGTFTELAAASYREN